MKYILKYRTVGTMIILTAIAILNLLSGQEITTFVVGGLVIFALSDLSKL